MTRTASRHDGSAGRPLPALRREFPILDRLVYLNAGSTGPVPHRAGAAAAASLVTQVKSGRSGMAHRDASIGARELIRQRVAALMACSPDEIALTRSTTDGINVILNSIGLTPGDEILTSDEEHPGLLAPLAALRARIGVKLRCVPFAELPNAVTPASRLVACSHVSWVSGQILDCSAFADSGVPVLLDGAQALGAIEVSPKTLGCAFYAASGQKWLCGPDQSGFLYISSDVVDGLGIPWPGFHSLRDPTRALDLSMADAARRFDTVVPSPHDAAWSLAAFEILEAVGWGHIFASGRRLAERLTARLRECGVPVTPRGQSTLVSFAVPSPDSFVATAAAAEVIIRSLPGRALARASVGAWSDDDDLERLVGLL